jgi:signal peptidase II
LLTKRAVLAAMTPGERHALIPGWLDIEYAQNEHGAMGLFGDHSVVLVTLALVVVVVLAVMLRSLIRESALAQVGFGLMVGGAMGNVVDRIIHHYVVDFIAPRWFYVFNGADACITVGLCLMAFASLRRPASA